MPHPWQPPSRRMYTVSSWTSTREICPPWAATAGLICSAKSFWMVSASGVCMPGLSEVSSGGRATSAKRTFSTSGKSRRTVFSIRTFTANSGVENPAPPSSRVSTPSSNPAKATAPPSSARVGRMRASRNSMSSAAIMPSGSSAPGAASPDCWRTAGRPESKCSMMARKIAGFRTCQSLSSRLPTVTESGSRDTPVTPSMANRRRARGERLDDSGSGNSAFPEARTASPGTNRRASGSARVSV